MVVLNVVTILILLTDNLTLVFLGIVDLGTRTAFRFLTDSSANQNFILTDWYAETASPWIQEFYIDLLPLALLFVDHCAYINTLSLMRAHLLKAAGYIKFVSKDARRIILSVTRVHTRANSPLIFLNRVRLHRLVATTRNKNVCIRVLSHTCQIPSKMGPLPVGDSSFTTSHFWHESYIYLVKNLLLRLQCKDVIFYLNCPGVSKTQSFILQAGKHFFLWLVYKYRLRKFLTPIVCE